MGISSQIGLDPKAFQKWHSFLVAADAACSRGDLPVTAEEAKLAAVLGLATATVTTAVPAELAAAVPELPSAARGAKHPCVAKGAVKMKSQIQNFGRIA